MVYSRSKFRMSVGFVDLGLVVCSPAKVAPRLGRALWGVLGRRLLLGNIGALIATKNILGGFFDMVIV